MPQKKQKNTVTCDEIVQIALSPEMVDQAISLSAKMDTVMPAVFALCEQGYSLQVLYDSERELWSVRLAGISPECKNAGKMLYGNGEGLQEAFASVYVKHFLVSDSQIWATISKSARRIS